MSDWPPSQNCYCGGPEEIYPHRHGTGYYCRREVPGPETCLRCEGSGIEPGTAELDMYTYLPISGAPCSHCEGSGNAPESPSAAPSPVSAATEAQGTPHDPAECIPCRSRAKHQEAGE